MSDKGRSPRNLLVIALALPIIALVYVTTFGGRLRAALRSTVATFLGLGVIGSIYAGEAVKRAPATPMRAAATLGLAVILVAPGISATPTVSAADPAEAVIAAARQYLGSNYRLGAEGPRSFDCSGLVYRAFADAGELPRIGGMRWRARGYMQYYVSRGRFSRDASDARRGDLIVYNRGSHIGFYLGDGEVLSALVQPWGVTTHGLRSINLPITYVLHVNWGGGDGGGDNGGGNNGGGNNGGGNNGGGGGDEPGGGEGDPPGDTDNVGGPGDNNGHNTNSRPDSTNVGGNDNGGGNEQPAEPNSSGGGESVRPNGVNAMALGTMNLRTSADPQARIIGWIGRNSAFRIIGEGKSPAGYPWFEVETRSGKKGWVYARWVRPA